MPRRKRRKTASDIRESDIILPDDRLYLPMSPFEKRMRGYPMPYILPPSHPDYENRVDDLIRIAQADIAFQIQYKKTMARLPYWVFAKMKSGSGFRMSKVLRVNFLECLHRFKYHGPHALPTSFNVFESFMTLNKEFLAFDLREEREHLLFANDYFEWYSQSLIPRDPSLLLETMQEGVVYSYDMASDFGGYYISTPESRIVLAGISMVRHHNELSCVLVAGENPAYPPDHEIQDFDKCELAPDRKGMKPAAELTVQSRYLEGFPKHARLHMLTRFDVKNGRYNVRYVCQDAGRSYVVLTDDISALYTLSADDQRECITNSLRSLKRYDSLFSALASLIYLPVAFIDERNRVKVSTFKTEFYTSRKTRHAKKAVAEFNEPVFAFERTINCLTNSPHSTDRTKQIVPPELTFARDGYWLPLSPGEVGADKENNPIVGRTWVERVDSWSAAGPSTFLLARESELPSGDDPGIIYIARSPSHVPDMYKVGLTRRTAERRATDLSGTGTPLPFAILAQWDVSNCGQVEREVHKLLDPYRVNSNREFFHCDLSTIVAAVNTIVVSSPQEAG